MVQTVHRQVRLNANNPCSYGKGGKDSSPDPQGLGGVELPVCMGPKDWGFSVRMMYRGTIPLLKYNGVVELL